MIALEQCIAEQSRIMAYEGPDVRGAQRGMEDWLMEEAIIRQQYADFLTSKRIESHPVGFNVARNDVNALLFDFQKDIVQWALMRGRAAIFADCGLGKTPIQLEWARHVCTHAGTVLILAPLAVAQQTKREGDKFGISVHVIRDQSQTIEKGINVCNYEMLEHFDPFSFSGIVLDESSILKSFDGTMRKRITDFAREIHYRLACTATPAPNDYMELGTHAEFLEVMNRTEMLSLFFVHDGGDTSKWRLKGHATDAFWKWVCSWAVALRKPSDLGYVDDGFVLPPLRMHQVVTDAVAPEGYLFPVEAKTLDERRSARRISLGDRVSACAELVNKSEDSWVVWCNLNCESEALSRSIDNSIEITGSDPREKKESDLMAFSSGQIPVIVTKPLIAGWGLNWQHCNKVVFVGLSDSYEQLYQAIRRCWRFGQTRPVDCYLITSEAEGSVVRNIERKEKLAMEMMEGMVEHMRETMRENLGRATRAQVDYEAGRESGEKWTAVLGDCVESCNEIADNSIDYSIFSPPFASLYTYSNSDRDMGNAKDYEEFTAHMGFLIEHLYRILKPGRLLSFHCMNLPLTKERDGVIGIRDFRGHLIRDFERHGFIYHSEVVIWKDPVTAMQRTKAIGLLYKQLKKDSVLSRQGIPDYLVTMRKSGVNQDPVTKDPDSFPVDRWQRYASPVWMDIQPSDTLQRESVREDEDERHICPLQLEVIRRAIELWTNPGDLVLSPFMGIGSEGHVALEMGRRFYGIELKDSYWKQAVANLKYAAEMADAQKSLDFSAELV